MNTLDCRNCGTPVKVDPRTVSCLCFQCTIETMWGAAPKVERKKIGYPKGWRFMKEFVHADGTVFRKGIEQPELKGSLPSTEIIVKPKKSAKQKAEEKAEAISKIAKLKKQLKSEQRKTQQKKLETQIKKLQTKL